MSKRIDTAIRMAKAAIAETLAAEKRNADDAKARAKRLRDARYTIIQPVLTRLAMMVQSLPEDQRRLSVDTYGKPSIRVTLLKQPSLKSDMVCELLEYASSICTRSAHSSDWVTAYCAERSHTFHGQDCTIIVSIDVSEEGTCRKVLKGQTTRTVDEYEFVCD
jgi:hypothetical protein